MKRECRVCSLEEKCAAVARMENITHGLLAAEPGVEKRVLYNWRKYLRRLDDTSKRAGSGERSLERENRRLKQALATKVLEADF